MTEIMLTGLDGSNPLGFMAALGTLEVLTDAGLDARLSWRNEGGWHPVLHGAGDRFNALALRILDDAHGPLVEATLGFRYVKMEKKGAKPFAGLAAPANVLRAWLRRRLAADDWKVADYGGALMCQTALQPMDTKKIAGPDELETAGIEFDETVSAAERVHMTPFDFTSRNAQFLDQLRYIRADLTLDGLRAELVEGRGRRTPRIMRWDPLVNLPGALSQKAPEPRSASEWLMFRAVSLFLLTRGRRTAQMPGFTGRRKSGEFSWVLWDGKLNRAVVKSILAFPALYDGTRGEGRARGVVAAFRVGMIKGADGYDGCFSPSSPLPI